MIKTIQISFALLMLPFIAFSEQFKSYEELEQQFNEDLKQAVLKKEISEKDTTQIYDQLDVLVENKLIDLNRSTRFYLCAGAALNIAYVFEVFQGKWCSSLNGYPGITLTAGPESLLSEDKEAELLGGIGLASAPAQAYGGVSLAVFMGEGEPEGIYFGGQGRAAGVLYGGEGMLLNREGNRDKSVLPGTIILGGVGVGSPGGVISSIRMRVE
ncbi:hypothetical protein MRY82_09915 [bacterium]|nr:hypothetical protein [bacterium]